MKNKRNKIANLFKIGTLFLGISLLLWNCEPEENHLIDKQEETPQLISYQEALKEPNFKNTISQFKLDSYISREKQSKSTEDEIKIYFEKFHKIEKENNKVTYTFYIKRHLKPEDVIIENLVVERDGDEVRGFIISYKDLHYTKEKTNLYLKGKSYKTPYKGNLNELLESSNLYLKGTWSCSTVNTYTLRKCSVHGTYNKDNTKCGNYQLNNWLVSSRRVCTITGDLSSEDPREAEDEFLYDGIGGGGSGSSTVITVPCEGNLLDISASGECIDQGISLAMLEFTSSLTETNCHGGIIQRMFLKEIRLNFS